ncbi:hypothetical protein V1264_015471 [Littorina saxatilis]|uniref:G-protein coupled receptors family 1 profile domain-containing protein n=1 Tax=Littorina saxatilis TaxID=31220 RepID=A0AAN9BL45_9CAEN
MEDILHRFCGQFSSNASKCSEEKLDDFRSYLSKESFRSRVPLLIYLGFVGVVGIVGNTIVVLVYWFKFTSSSKQVFILSMALCDLLMNIVTIPIKVVAIRHAYDAKVWVCKTEWVTEHCPAVLSMLILYAVAVDRCNRVCRPHSRQLSVRQSLYVVVALVMATAALFLPFNVAYGAARWDTAIAGVQVKMCSLGPRRTLAGTAHFVIVTSIFGIGFLLLLVCYVSIFVKVRSSDRRVTRSPVVCQFSKTNNQWRATITAPDKSQLKKDLDLPLDSTLDPRPSCEAKDLPLEPPASQQASSSFGNTLGDAQAATSASVSFERACTADFTIKNESIGTTSVEQRRTSFPQLSRSKVPNISNATTVFGFRTMESGARKSRVLDRSTRMMAVLSVVFLVDWIPFLVASLMRTTHYLWCENLTDCEDNLLQIAHLSFYINSMANPLVYSFTNKEFRDKCVNMFRNWCKKL